jgi:hypothetical protein
MIQPQKQLLWPRMSLQCGNVLFFPSCHSYYCAASQQINEACLDIYEGWLVSLRGPFEAGMHDMTVFCGGKEEDKKENWDHDALYFKIRQGDQIVGDSGYDCEPSKIVVMRDEHSKEFKKILIRVCSRQETFFKGAQRLENSQRPFCLWKHHPR